MSAHQRNKPERAKIPANVRVMIAIVATPTLAVLAFVVYSIITGGLITLSLTGIIFSTLCIFAYYIVIVGRLPAWLNFKKSPKA